MGDGDQALVKPINDRQDTVLGLKTVWSNPQSITMPGFLGETVELHHLPGKEKIQTTVVMELLEDPD
jgi:hypothetical protein